MSMIRAMWEWVQSNDPCTPEQAAIFLAVVVFVMTTELVGLAWLCARDGRGVR